MSIKIIKDLGMLYPDNGYKKRRFHYWLVECECGKRFKTQNAKKIQYCVECGNKYAGKNRTKHGYCVRSKDKHIKRLNTIYYSIKQRCYNPNHKNYKNYGGSGVTMCNKWLNSIDKFIEWALNNGYRDDLDIDKDELCEKLNIYPKIYSPQTCIWKPKKENSKSNLKLTEDIEKDIIDMYKNNIKISEIAKKHNYSWNGIKAILIKNNLYKRAKK